MVAVAHFPGLDPFGPELRRRVEAVADVPSWEPLVELRGPRADAALAPADVLLGHWGCPLVDDDVLDRAPRLRLLAYGGGTVKQTVTPGALARGLVVTTASSANAVPVAEYALAVILLANKAAFAARELARDPTSWDPPPALRVPGNRHKRVGVVGASTIGRLLLAHLGRFELEAVVADPYLDEPGAQALGARLVPMDDLLATSDVVSLHAPLLPETVGMIGARELALMGDGATLVNTARGALVDWDALEAELVSGRLSAVLDVTDPHEPVPPAWAPLRRPNVFVTPHLAGAQGTEVERLSELAVAEVEHFAHGEPPRHPVRLEAWDRLA